MDSVPKTGKRDELTVMRRLALLVPLALGCHRVGVPLNEQGDEDPSACDGLLTRTPTVLAETISYAPDLIVDGDSLVLVEPGQHGVLRRLDRCSAQERSSTPVPFLDRAILHDGAIVFTGIYEGPITRLNRWDEPAGQFESLTDAPFARLFSHSSGLYLGAKEQIFRFDEASATLELVYTIDTLDIPGLTVSHIGINEAGLYYRRDYDCGCTPSLSRWPIGSSEASGVPGSPGARRLASVGDRIFINAEQVPSGFGSGVDDIVELPAEGGEPQVWFSGNLDDGPVQSIAANEQWVCWTNLARAPRCVSRSDPSELVEIADPLEGGGVHRRLAIAEDAVYWFVEQNGESTLMAAAL
jgi:hypothetical protein